MNRLLSIALFAGLLLFLSACSSKKEGNLAFKGDPVRVTVTKISAGSIEDGTTLSGKIISKNAVNVSTRVMGYISSLPVSLGQQITKGQLLATINSADLDAKNRQTDAQIGQAQANYENAKKDLGRFQNLFDKGSASQKELDDMTTRFKMAESGLNAAKAMKEEVAANRFYTHITAPISGIITEKQAESGDLASPGMPLLRIESTQTLQAEVFVPENYIDQVQKGMRVTIQRSASSADMDGVVTEVGKSATFSAGQYRVKINLSSADDFFPGMLVRVQFPFAIQQDHGLSSSSVFIPKSALTREGQLQGVYVVSSQSTAILRWVRTGKEQGDLIEILSGLAPQDSYISSAKGRLFNGALIQIEK